MNRRRITLIALGIVAIGVGLFALSKLLRNPRSTSEPSAADFLCKDCNLVIISLTNVRKDHVGLYGYDRATTPNLDKFFANGLVFDDVYGHASWTLPQAASFQSATYPYSHGVMHRFLLEGYGMPKWLLTLPEILHADGYRTAGVTGGTDYNRVYNVMRGFDFYVDEDTYASLGIDKFVRRGQAGYPTYGRIESLVPVAVDWLRKNHDHKFFLFLQSYDAHCPFNPKPPYDKQFDPDYGGTVDFSRCMMTFDAAPRVEENGVGGYRVHSLEVGGGVTPGKPGPQKPDTFLSDRDITHMIARYDGAISLADTNVKGLLDEIEALGLERNTVVVFMSEHGDLFGEHGRFMRGGPLRGTFYEPVLNIPFVMRIPGMRERKHIDSLVGTVDLMPTLLDLLAVKDPMPDARDGHSIAPSLRGNGKEPNERVYAGSQFMGCPGNLLVTGLSVVEAVRDREWKLIREESKDLNPASLSATTYQLFHLATDPKERLDVYSANIDRARALEAWLRRGMPPRPDANYCDLLMGKRTPPPTPPPDAGAR